MLTAVHTGSGAAGALPMIGYSILFTAVMLLGVSRLLRPLARHVGRQGTLSPGVMYVVVIVPIVCGYLTDLIGIVAVFGGFSAGLAMPRDPQFRQALHSRMMGAVSALLLPILFALPGLTTDLQSISADTLLFGVAALLVGSARNHLGGALAMKTLRYHGGHRDGAASGVRGAAGSVRGIRKGDFWTDSRDAGATKLAKAVAAERSERVRVLGGFNGTMDDRADGLTSRLRSVLDVAGDGFGFRWPARWRGSVKPWSVAWSRRPVVARIRWLAAGG
nr:cation:proton antiporter [Streptomyces sp. NBC_01237]